MDHTLYLPTELAHAILDLLALSDIVRVSLTSLRWRSIAFEHPKYWHNIALACPPSLDTDADPTCIRKLDFAGARLARSSQIPVTLRVVCCACRWKEADDGAGALDRFLRVVAANTHRIQKLHIDLHGRDMQRLLCRTAEADAWRSPLLEELTVFSRECRAYLPLQGLVLTAPHLRSLQLQNVGLPLEPDVVFPNLDELSCSDVCQVQTSRSCHIDLIETNILLPVASADNQSYTRLFQVPPCPGGTDLLIASFPNLRKFSLLSGSKLELSHPPSLAFQHWSRHLTRVHVDAYSLRLFGDTSALAETPFLCVRFHQDDPDLVQHLLTRVHSASSCLSVRYGSGHSFNEISVTDSSTSESSVAPSHCTHTRVVEYPASLGSRVIWDYAAIAQHLTVAPWDWNRIAKTFSTFPRLLSLTLCNVNSMLAEAQERATCPQLQLLRLKGSQHRVLALIDSADIVTNFVRLRLKDVKPGLVLELRDIELTGDPTQLQSTVRSWTVHHSSVDQTPGTVGQLVGLDLDRL